MPKGADHHLSMATGRGLPAPDVHSLSYHLKVGGIHAMANAAEVINRQVGWNGAPSDQLVGEPMRTDMDGPRPTSRRNNPIATVIDPATPRPTGGWTTRLIDPAPEVL